MTEQDTWSVDELARLADTTVRNVRAYQERGLLPPPVREGRRAIYGLTHLQRLRLIGTLLARGYSLGAIAELTDAWDQNRSLADVLGYEQALNDAFTGEPPRTYTPDELLELFPDDAEGVALAMAVDAGILEPVRGGYSAAVPSLIDVAAQLRATGVPSVAVVQVGGHLLRAAGELAELFVDLYIEHVWKPFAHGDQSVEAWARMTKILNTQQELAVRAVVSALTRAMRERVHQAADVTATPDLGLEPPSSADGKPGR